MLLAPALPAVLVKGAGTRANYPALIITVQSFVNPASTAAQYRYYVYLVIDTWYRNCKTVQNTGAEYIDCVIAFDEKTVDN